MQHVDNGSTNVIPTDIFSHEFLLHPHVWVCPASEKSVDVSWQREVHADT